MTGSNGLSDAFLYNGLGQRTAKNDSTGQYALVSDGAAPAAPVLADGGTVYTPGLSSRKNGSSEFRHGDLLGSLRFLTDANQTVVGDRLFSAFGATVASDGDPATPFGWVGDGESQTDADTGLVLMGHRVYDSRLGRFLSQDPAGAGDNWYAYCGNDPVNGTDPLGLVCPDFPSTGMSEEQIRNHILENDGLPGETYNTISNGKTIYTYTVPKNFDGVIPGFYPSRNIAEARNFANGGGTFSNGYYGTGVQYKHSGTEKMAFFVWHVFPNHDWDVKNTLPGKTTNPLYHIADIIGQWNYGGAAAALGMGKKKVLMGAGAAQNMQAFLLGGTVGLQGNVQQNGMPSTGPPYGDDRWAQKYIGLGYDANR